MKIRVASWNIAGGHKIASLEHFDYQPEDISYFVNQLKNVSADIVCLQETHTKIDGMQSNAADIASGLGMNVIVNSPNSPSHVDSSYQLGNAIISSMKASGVVETYYPDPEGQLYWADGRTAITHRKNLQFVSFDGFNVANNQMLPVSLFGFTYDDGGKGTKLTEGINTVMEDTLKAPLIWGGDFNFYEPLKIYPFMNQIELRESLPDVTTRPTKDGSKKNPDHIFYTPEFTLINSQVVVTETDHFLCLAEFEI